MILSMLPLVYHHNYSCPFPNDHRFVMSKFRRLYETLADKAIITSDRSNLFTPHRASLEDLSIAHCPDYLALLQNNRIDERQWRRVGLPWSRALINRTHTAPNGTLLAARLALRHGIACHLAGGTHHAHRDFGSGFCLVNDLAYAALQLIATKQVKRLLVFDCDVHQGDGTATILAEAATIYTCSIHCEKNFPLQKCASDCDVGLPADLGDDDYLGIVDATLRRLLALTWPDLVLYDAGVDIWQHDPLGKLDVSWRGIERRDRLVLQHCLRKGIPVATVIGGGYDQDHGRLAARHAIVFEQAHLLVNG